MRRVDGDVREELMTEEARCHYCGCELRNAAGPFRGFELKYPSGTLHVLCDSDCLRQWLADEQRLFEHDLAAQMREMYGTPHE
jgi:hypothetical protein